MSGRAPGPLEAVAAHRHPQFLRQLPGKQVCLVERANDLPAAVKRHRQNTRWGCLCLLLHSGGQFAAEDVSAGQIPVEFEPADEMVYRVTIRQGGKAKVPGRSPAQAQAANVPAGFSQRQTALPAGMINSGQFSGTRRTQVVGPAGKAAQYTVARQQQVDKGVETEVMVMPHESVIPPGCRIWPTSSMRQR